MKKSTLHYKLLKYKKKIYPFHMPGHKLGRKLNIKNTISIDVTEVEGTDNLHHPKGVIMEAQDRAANTFGADKTFFLVNGSTGGIMAAISTICMEKDKILVSRNCHKSVYNSIILNDLEPIYIIPEIIKTNGIVGGINPQQIEDNLINYPDIKLVVITSPTYEGFVSNIKEVAKIVHKYGSILMVDEAHGAHFKFHDYFPKTSIDQGADIIIQSTHKTLPAFTQSAMLHVNYDRIDCIKLQDKLSVFQTSSPSYMLINSLDNCREILDTKGKKMFNKYVKMLKRCRYELKNNLKNLKIIDNEVIGTNQIYDMDYSKIVIDSSSTNISGTELDEILRNKYNIQVELSNINHIIAMTSICDSKQGFRRLVKAILEIDRKLEKENQKLDKYDIIYHADKYYNPKEACNMGKTTIKLEDSIGKIAGEFIIPFPPGVPLIIPGEIITADNISIIRKFKELKIEMMGLKDTEAKTIQIIKRGVT